MGDVTFFPGVRVMRGGAPGREIDLIRALQEIATGHSGRGAAADLAVVRQVARDALERAGYGGTFDNDDGGDLPPRAA